MTLSSNDSVIKFLWYYYNAVGRPEKRKIIARKRGYHGVTVASASMTGLPNNHRDFDLPLPRFLYLECPHHYRNALPNETLEAFCGRLADELETLIANEVA